MIMQWNHANSSFDGKIDFVIFNYSNCCYGILFSKLTKQNGGVNAYFGVKKMNILIRAM